MSEVAYTLFRIKKHFLILKLIMLSFDEFKKILNMDLSDEQVLEVKKSMEEMAEFIIERKLQELVKK